MLKLILAALLALPLAPRAAELDAFVRKAEMNPDDAAAQFNLAVKAREAGKLKQALKAAEKATKLTPEDAVAWELRGQLEVENGNEEAAVASYEKAVALDGKRAGALAQLAKIYGARGDKDSLRKALAVYESAAKVNPKNVKLLINQGVLWSKLGDDKKALGVFEKASKLEGGAQAAARYLCQIYNLLGDSKKAESACLLASKDPKASAETWYYLGFAQNRLEKKAEANKSFRKSIGLDSHYAPALYSTGFGDYESGKLEEALANFRAAVLAKNGDYPEAQFNVGVVLGDLGRWDEAADVYRRILKKEPDNADAKSNLEYVVSTGSEALLSQGKDFYESGNFDGAGKAWEKVLKLDPANTTAADFLKKVRAKSDASAKSLAARQAARKAISSKLKSEDEKILKEGLAAMKAGKLAQAVRSLEFYVKKHPEAKTPLQALYRARADLRQKVDELLAKAGRDLAAGDKAAAKASIQEALALDANNSRANKMLASVTGSAGEAKVSAEQVKKKYFMGVDAYLAGDLPKAIQVWKGILVGDPGNLDAKRSLLQAEEELRALKSRK